MQGGLKRYGVFLLAIVVVFSFLSMSVGVVNVIGDEEDPCEGCECCNENQYCCDDDCCSNPGTCCDKDCCSGTCCSKTTCSGGGGREGSSSGGSCNTSYECCIDGECCRGECCHGDCCGVGECCKGATPKCCVDVVGGYCCGSSQTCCLTNCCNEGTDCCSGINGKDCCNTATGESCCKGTCCTSNKCCSGNACVEKCDPDGEECEWTYPPVENTRLCTNTNPETLACFEGDINDLCSWVVEYEYSTRAKCADCDSDCRVSDDFCAKLWPRFCENTYGGILVGDICTCSATSGEDGLVNPEYRGTHYVCK